MDVQAFTRVLFRRWPVGAIVALAFVMVGTLVSLILPPVYEAKALILVSRPPIQVGAPPDPTGPGLKIGEVLSQELPAAAVVEFAMSDSAMQSLAAIVPPPKQISERLAARPVLGTDLVELVVRGRDPRRVAVVGRAWARVVDSTGDAIFQADANTTHGFFEEQVQNAAARLATAQMALRNFDVTTPLGLLQARVNAMTAQISNYQSRITDLEVSLQSQRATLAGITDQIRGQPATFVLRKSLTTDPFLLQAAGEVAHEGAIESSRLALKSEELNPIYLQLDQARANAEVQISAAEAERVATLRMVDQLVQALSGLRSRLADGQLQRAVLLDTVANAGQTYSVLVERRNETGVASVVKGHPVHLIADTVIPTHPVAPKRRLILAMSTLFGCMLGMLAVFGAEYYAVRDPLAEFPGSPRVDPGSEA